MIYDEAEFSQVTPSEAPDFKVTCREDGNTFGVEVTEFYYTQSDARLQNIPGYVNEIVYGGAYRHRVDREVLEAQDFVVERGGKPHHGVRGILQEAPTVHEYIQMVADVIASKDEKARSYGASVDHVNLIVVDMERRLSALPTQDFAHVFITPTMRSLLVSTGFREVFFITLLDQQKWAYVPLKMMVLVSSRYLFQGLIHHHYSRTSNRVLSHDDVSRLYAQYLRHSGIGEVRTRNDTDGVEVICSGYGLVVTPERGLQIRDYADHAVSHLGDPAICPVDSPVVDPLFERTEAAYRQEVVFCGGPVMDAREEGLRGFGIHPKTTTRLSSPNQ